MNANVFPSVLLRAEPVQAASVAVEDISTNKGGQDWNQLVSPGHVLGRRVVRAGSIMFLPALAVFCAVGFHTLHVMAGLGGVSLPLPRLPLPLMTYDLPESVRGALTYDPNTYTDLQGGVRTSYKYAWLTEIPRSRGLTVQAWQDLAAAVRADVQSNGINTDKWTAVPALDTAPKVTRPQKAFGEHVARLGTGIVTVSSQGEVPRVHVVAMVDGAWAWTTLSQFGCQQSFGPPVSGCAQIGARPEINDLRPSK
ncbi:hypothetical protein [Methylobacterium radiotolerans]|uniref:hypothetical protein n=1 Tax=Methylobacterium radiotolerans TaxID=31998 RepID=UPI001F42A227|nr:hypothetical protein [Methylobacterium radiotolerans]UIY45847.1 hypothetical protein LZ599_32365 [Methylobacterium radiotolerans]